MRATPRRRVRGWPPSGRRASQLPPEAPEGIVIAEWGWSDALEITLWPSGDTVGVTGTASRLQG